MDNSINFIGFLVEKQQFGLPIDVVERVVHVVETNTFPKMPKFLHGIIDMQGTVIPVLNVHVLFGFPFKEVQLSNQLIIANFSKGKIALLVDSTLEVFNISKNDMVNSSEIIYGNKLVSGVVKLNQDLVLVNDIEKFLDDKQLVELEGIKKKLK